MNKNTRLFIIKNLCNDGFCSVSSFILHKTIKSTIGDVESLKKLKSGDLLIKVSNASQAQSLSAIKTLGSFSVSVLPHNTLNFSKGVISESEFYNVSEEEILENLSDQGVVGVRRITIRRGTETFKTKHIILTFNSPKLPSHITAAYLRCPIRPYIPNPLRCFHCQRFGHSKAACRGSMVCARCSVAGHASEGCSNTVKCFNCNGDHPSFSKSCPKWQYEKEIQAVRTKQNLTYPEARKIVDSRNPKAGVSYAAAIQKELKSVSTQTDLLHNNKPSNGNNNQTTIKPTIKTSNNKSTTCKQNNTNIACNSNKNNKQSVKRRLKPLPSNHPLRQKLPPPSIKIKTKLKRTDFLKKDKAEVTFSDEPIKMYVSPEEDMSAESSPGSETESLNSIP